MRQPSLQAEVHMARNKIKLEGVLLVSVHMLMFERLC